VVSNTISFLDGQRFANNFVRFQDNSGFLITPKSSIDVTYGIKLADLSVGGQLGVAGDDATIDSLKISSSVKHLRGGVSLNIGNFAFDVSVGLQILGYKHERIQPAGTNPFLVEGDGGLGINLQGRIIIPIWSDTKLIPILSFIQSGIGTSTSGPGPIKETVFENSSTNINVGAGLNHDYDENTTLIAAVLLSKFTSTSKDTTGGTMSEISITINSFPRIIIGMESKLKDWITFRTSINRNLGGTGLTTKFAGTERDFRDRGEAYTLSIGTGIYYKNITLDGLFVNSFFFTGPGLLSQVASNIFSQASISYSF